MDKLQFARESILHRIECGEFPAEAKLPAAAKYCETIGVSFVVVQLAYNSLIRDGILYSIPRQGTFVRKDWRSRILPGSIQTYRSVWLELLKPLKAETPELFLSNSFCEGAFEIRFSNDTQLHASEYLDLTEFFEAEFPDKSDFFQEKIEQFRSRHGKLFGIPLIFSPWVICYHPDLIAEAGAPEPHSGWSWEEFLNLIRLLRRNLPPSRAFRLVSSSSIWMNFFLRAGGEIMGSREEGYPILLDGAASVDALYRLRELRDAIGEVEESPFNYREAFLKKETAMIVGTRQDAAFHNPHPWRCVPLPRIPGGRECMRIGGDLFCVRRIVNDFHLVRKLIGYLFSPQLQDRLGALGYGIPIRRSSAIRSFNEHDPRDMVFLSEMAKIHPLNHFAWPELQVLINHALPRTWLLQESPETMTGELAAVLRAIIRYEHNPFYHQKENSHDRNF